MWVSLVEDHCQDNKLCQVGEVDDAGLRGNVRAQVKGALSGSVPGYSPQGAECYQLQQYQVAAAAREAVREYV